MDPPDRDDADEDLAEIPSEEEHIEEEHAAPTPSTDPRTLDELLAMLVSQREAEARERETRPAKRQKTKEQTMSRERRREARKAKWGTRVVYTAPASVQQQRKHKYTTCCAKACTAPYENDPVALFKLRDHFQSLPETGRTAFISNRVRERPSKPGVNTSRKGVAKTYTLETAT